MAKRKPVATKSVSEVPSKPCGVCGQYKPINQYCTNDCRYLIDAKLEDAVIGILSRYHIHYMKPLEAYKSMMYVIKAAYEQ